MANVLVVLLALALGGCATQSQKESRPTVMKTDKDKTADATPVTPPEPAPAAAPKSTVAELQGLIAQREVKELRTTYNGNYGASLLFKPDELVYYVALFQQKNFWRVVKTPDASLANQTYRKFARESADLAKADLRSITLQAEYAHTEKELDERSGRVSMLKNDLAVQRQQESVIAEQQKKARQEAAELAGQQRQAKEQLRELQRQIRELEAQQAALSGKTGVDSKPGKVQQGS